MILLFSSRLLCYESNLTFINSMSRALDELGEENRIVTLDKNWQEELENIPSGQYRAIVDFNSFLPRLEDDGKAYLDRFDAPFFNYIVDHPMYHHPGLSAKLQRSGVLCVDCFHAKYIKENYENVENAYYLPLTAEKADINIPFEKRKNDITLMATMVDECDIMKDISRFPEVYRKHILNLADIIYSNPHKTQEELAKDYLEKEYRVKEVSAVAEEPLRVFMNNVCIADKLARYRRRKAFATALLKEKLPVTLVGEGWEKTIDQFATPQVNYYPGVSFKTSYSVMANSKIMLNLSPEFHGGIHDRVYAGMANGCAMITDANVKTVEEFKEGREIVTFDRGNTSDFVEKVYEIFDSKDRAAEIGQNAVSHFDKTDTWTDRMSTFLGLLLQ